MKRTHKNFVALSALALPLLVTIGCAGTESHLAAIDESYLTEPSATDETLYGTEYSLENIELGAEATSQSDAPIEAEPAQQIDTTFDELAARYQHEIDQAAADATVQKAVIELALQESSADETLPDNVAVEMQEALLENSVEVVAATEMQASVMPEHMPAQTPAQTRAPIMGQPQKNVIHFSFDKYEIDAADIDELKQHAQYLLQYPHLTLVVSGHTDSVGPKLYNQRLSELRAQSVAGILLAEGVPESQIQISGLADVVPVTDPKKYRENRRVELTYQDSMLVSNQ